MRKTILGLAIMLPLLAVAIFSSTPGNAQTAAGVTTIHLTEHNGYFSAQETLMDIKPGTYVFEVKNDAGKMVGFQVQNLKTHEQLAMGPLKPGETKEFKVEVTGDGFRYRCPINPTPWYEVSFM